MDLADLEVFAEAVSVGSLAGAARRLGISSMAASRRLAALEAQTGVRLVHRTTRALAPTAEGEALLPHALAMLNEHAEALAALRAGTAGVSGHLRVTASAAFGRRVVAPMLAPFLAANPELQLELSMTDDQVDIVGQGIDVAIRIARLRENNLIARRLADNPRCLCVAPGYAARHGLPLRMAELAAHACLAPTGVTHWSFVRGGRTVRQRVAGRFTANAIEALHRACLDGLGIANVSRWLIADDLASGALREVVLEDAHPEPLAVWAVYPTARMVPHRARAFVEALEGHLRTGTFAA